MRWYLCALETFTGMLDLGILLSITLDDQTQVDSKPAGQPEPEHVSLNQC